MRSSLTNYNYGPASVAGPCPIMNGRKLPPVILNSYISLIYYFATEIMHLGLQHITKPGTWLVINLCFKSNYSLEY